MRMILALLAWTSLALGAAAPAHSPTTSVKAGAPAIALHATKSGHSDVDYGGLPPAERWTLMLVGFGMIGGAIRGFIVAHRALRKLQPDGED